MKFRREIGSDKTHDGSNFLSKNNHYSFKAGLFQKDRGEPI